jgi:hypothetical protein
MDRRNWVIAMAFAVFALLLLTYRLSDIVGLHGDEAWVLLRTHELSAGRFSLDGMNNYTGTLHHFLGWPFVAMFGAGPLAIRLAGALLNALAIFFLALLLLRLHPGQSFIRNWTLALVVTCFSFVMQSRLAFEITMVQPLLLLAAAWLLVVAADAESNGRNRTASLTAGILLGIAAYSHLIAVATIIGLGVGALVGYGWRVALEPLARSLLVGFAVGLTPRLYSLVRGSLRGKTPEVLDPFLLSAPADMVALTWQKIAAGVGSLAYDVIYAPRLLGRILDGDILFLRFTGETLLPVMPFFSVPLVVLAVWAAYRFGFRLSSLDRALLVSFVTSFVLLVLITHHLSLRYFELHAMACCYVLIRLVDTMRRDNQWASWRGSIGLLPAAVLSLQVTYLGINYFWSFSQSAGRERDFPVGMRLVETSKHFIPTARLYEQLSAAGVRVAFGQEMICWPMAAADIGHDRLSTHAARSHRLINPNATNSAPAGSVAMIYYATDKDKYDPNFDPISTSQIRIGTRIFARNNTFDPKFAVYIITTVDN